MPAKMMPSEVRRRPVRWWRVAREFSRSLVPLAGILTWLWIALVSVFLTLVLANDPDPGIGWLYDWHVYAAGATDLAARELYREPLEFTGWPLPVDTYNLPPFSAVWPLPLLLLPDEAAGIAWITIGGIAWASAWWAAMRLMGVRHAWAWTGMALALYSALPWFGTNLLLGNINHLVLGLLVAFTVALCRGHGRLSGVLLGLAIATKLWPCVLLMPLLRQRSWSIASWSVGTALVLTAVPMVWLGIDVTAAMFDALRLRVPIEPGVVVLWTTAFREMWGWWPGWGGLAVGIVLLAIPGRGLPGVGLAILGGISVIPNIWDHYLPTLAVGLLFVLGGIAWPVPVQRWSSNWRLARSASGQLD